MSARPRPECGAAAPTVRRKSETTEPSGGFVVYRWRPHQKTVMPRMKAIVGSAKLAKKP